MYAYNLLMQHSIALGAAFVSSNQAKLLMALVLNSGL